MKWIACAVALSLAACQSGSAAEPPPARDQATTVIQLPKPQVTDDYRADIATLCDVMRLSGADSQPVDAQVQVIAMWLGPHIKTEEGRDFLAAIQPLKGEPKALALESEAKRVGIAKCDLANQWRK